MERTKRRRHLKAQPLHSLDSTYIQYSRMDYLPLHSLSYLHLNNIISPCLLSFPLLFCLSEILLYGTVARWPFPLSLSSPTLGRHEILINAARAKKREIHTMAEMFLSSSFLFLFCGSAKNANVVFLPIV